ncbi:lysoplasmalogenase [Caulobacter sp. DWR1-3-2b1]|uniref:lysoplasmalogenase n=1 Tax=Caulobacter sp. DWR1-3-2b1 TaxID=2804670 RepID=UPI003CF78319
MDTKDRMARWVLVASIIAGVSYVASWDRGLPQAAELTWKGLGVGLLAVYAMLKARSLDGWLLVAVMAFGALGDVLLGAMGLTVGALAFLVGHLIAIGLYLRNRRQTLSRSQLALAVVLVPATVIIAWLLPSDRAGASGVALYSLGLSLMAATAWISRFHRFRVGIGAVMFVVSDLLIFGRAGPLADSFVVGLGVWGLYYFGQLLICVGVVQGLNPSPLAGEGGLRSRSDEGSHSPVR